MMRTIEWLSRMEDDELAELERGASLRRFARGELIFAPTRQPQSVYLLQAGLARIYRLSEGGGETSFGYVAPGEVFGELPAFGEYPRESFAEAVRASAVWKIPRENFQQVLAARSALAFQVSLQIGDRLKKIESRVEDLVFRNVRTRVARMLGELAADFGQTENGHRVIDIPITQSELATLVGATRQTVNQTLRELSAEGLIGRDNRRIVLLRPERLRELVHQTAPG
ncbi:MAG: Crp/Fnr family transcriptional regulator [Deltaproteobacteria bacterium]|nr:Crp/Fnr family transcriptional regulator [Deltaproteobacteria bacterium]